MKIRTSVLKAAFVFFVSASVSPAYSTSSPIARAIIDQDVADGCGCALSTVGKNSQLVFWTDFENTWMTLFGKDVTLRKVKEAGIIEGKGDRFSEGYSFGSVSVVVDYLITSDCSSGDPDCEGTSVRALITVTDGKKEELIKTEGYREC